MRSLRLTPPTIAGAGLLLTAAVLLTLGGAHARVQAGLASPGHGTATARVRHVGIRGCRCTERLRAELARRPMPEEFVWLDELSPEERPAAAPSLLIYGPDGGLIYVGGYDAAPVWDQAIRGELARGLTPRQRGIDGCERARSARMALRRWWQ